MNIKERELLDYLANSQKANVLNNQIQELEDKLKQVDKAIDGGYFRSSTTDALATEAHKLRIRKLGLEINLNTVERKILQFELAEELRD